MLDDNTENNGVTPTPEESQTPAPSQKPQRDEKEKAKFTLKSVAKRIQDEFGEDPAEVLGLKPKIEFDESLPDDAPLTVGTYRQMQKQDARKTAEQMADELSDDEREQVKSELKYIVPSGNAEDDLRRARAAANATRNAKIVEEAARKTAPRITAAGGSSPAPTEDEFTPTPQEAIFMKPPYNMSKDKILEARKKQ